MKTRFFSLLLALLSATCAFAEWRTESYMLRQGWNAIYPTVDASHTTLDTLLAAYPRVIEVWRWQPEQVDRRLPDDITDVPSGIEWSVWKRGLPAETTFTQLEANYGYLVRLNGNGQLVVSIKGQATLPEVRWRGDGLQLAGFPVLTTGTRPTFSTYLAPTGFAAGSADVLRYNGGGIGGNNPAAINPTTTRIDRGIAYWVRMETFSRYYGPLKVEIDTGTRVDFGTRSDPVKVLLTNQTTGDLTFTLATAASEAPPAGEVAVAGSVPLKVEVDAETTYTALTAPRTLTLAPGAIMPVRLVVDRASMPGAVGTHYASMLQLTTTAGLAGQEVFVPVTAEVSSLAGLWMGEAMVTQVGSVAIRYQRDAAGNTVYDGDGRPRILQDLTTPGSAGTLPAVSKGYPLRIILHVNLSGQATLLSHVYQGKLAVAPPDAPIGLVTREALLDPTSLRDAVRLSVAHLPLDTELALAGPFATGGTLASGANLVTRYTAADNPFLHVYHPDHDNLDARFQNLLQAGKESFEIKRSLTLTVDPAPPLDAPTSWGTTTITGTYSEFIEGPYKTPLRVQGLFGLYKVSDIPALTRP
jgi:hypothetical protein